MDLAQVIYDQRSADYNRVCVSVSTRKTKLLRFRRCTTLQRTPTEVHPIKGAHEQTSRTRSPATSDQRMGRLFFVYFARSVNKSE